MPTVFSHPAPFVCLGLACGRLLSARLLLAGIVCSLLPDADALAFRFNIPYASILGHRGLSHSLAFALALGLAAALIAPLLRSGRKTAFVVCAGAALSHILLDAMTDGGLGVAAFWPFSEARYFLPWRPIAVSPLALRHFFSQHGINVLGSEARLIWLPCLAGALGILLVRLTHKVARLAVSPANKMGFPKGVHTEPVPPAPFGRRRQ